MISIRGNTLIDVYGDGFRYYYYLIINSAAIHCN
jgi:hypothetical protein